MNKLEIVLNEIRLGFNKKYIYFSCTMHTVQLKIQSEALTPIALKLNAQRIFWPINTRHLIIMPRLSANEISPRITHEAPK